MQGTAIRVTAIWDRDHGTDCEGWYIRFRLDDGQELDSPESGTDRPIDESESALRDLVEQQARWEGIELPAGWELEIHR